MPMHIKPARAGLIVRDPSAGNAAIPDEGKPYVKSLALVRAINDGDAVLFDPDAERRKAEAEQAKRVEKPAKVEPRKLPATKDEK